MTRQELVQQIYQKGSYLLVGLDTDPAKLPQQFDRSTAGMLAFNKAIIDATKDFCVGYKINTAFYEAHGVKGWEVMEETVNYIPRNHFTIADAKRGDIGNTSSQYARAFFETLHFDAVTVAPYMGEDSVKPFLEFSDKWTILLGLTSNPGAKDFELRRLWPQENAGKQTGGSSPDPSSHQTEFLYERVMQTAATWGNEGNLMFVVGATRSEEFTNIRRLTPNHFYLVPGVGAQGGSLKDISEKAMTSDCGILVNASRAIIYASGGDDFAEAATDVARQYAGEMKTYLGN
ncbi:orotidine-5'-phosphate decarboxylase [Flavisolibacter nicotianae]|uniref:orotidine-5'-phosphate decarboxylase n=1 Tax=Flavisolibacter nicotianae TaxID=2364882 RepID=UPI000EB0CFFB|nr:orotidine-5'-phosphate decarboxylase [Flavisolibacter nicotianae]